MFLSSFPNGVFSLVGVGFGLPRQLLPPIDPYTTCDGVWSRAEPSLSVDCLDH